MLKNNAQSNHSFFASSMRMPFILLFLVCACAVALYAEGTNAESDEAHVRPHVHLESVGFDYASLTHTARTLVVDESVAISFTANARVSFRPVISRVLSNEGFAYYHFPWTFVEEQKRGAYTLHAYFPDEGEYRLTLYKQRDTTPLLTYTIVVKSVLSPEALVSNLAAEPGLFRLEDETRIESDIILWETNMTKALARAQTNRKHLFVFIDNSKNESAKRMRTTSLARKRIVDAVNNNFIPVRVITKGFHEGETEETATTILFTRYSDGKTITNFSFFVNEKALYTAIEEVVHYETRNEIERLRSAFGEGDLSEGVHLFNLLFKTEAYFEGVMVATRLIKENALSKEEAPRVYCDLGTYYIETAQDYEKAFSYFEYVAKNYSPDSGYYYFYAVYEMGMAAFKKGDKAWGMNLMYLCATSKDVSPLWRKYYQVLMQWMVDHYMK